MERSLQSIVCVIIAYMVFLALVNSTFGIEDFRIMYTFSTDEPYIVSQVAANLSMNELVPWHHYNYGYNYNSLGFILLKISSYFGYHANQIHFIAYTLRLISLGSYLLTLLLFYLSLRKLQIPGILSTVFTLFLASMPEVYYWAQMVHPDMLALLFIVCAWFMIILKQDAFGLLTSVIFAGLAFGTKYTGIFLLPFLCIPYVLNIIWSDSPRTTRIVRSVLAGIGVLVVFLLIWVSTNPSVITFYQEFLKDVAFESGHIARGHGKTEATNPFLWFPVLYQQFSFAGSAILIIGYILGGTALLIFGRTALANRRNGMAIKKICTNYHLVVLSLCLYTIVCFGYIMFKVNIRAPRYLFHVFPSILLLSGVGFTWLYMRIPSKLHILVSCILLSAVISLSVSSIRAHNDFSKKPLDEAVLAGNWLEKTYPPSTKILYEIYSYIPPAFKNIKMSWYITEKAIQEFEPDILILTQKASGRISWKKPGTAFMEGEFTKDETVDYAEEIINFHNTLFLRENRLWRIVYETESVVILAKRNYSAIE